MARIKWDEDGHKLYETGVRQAVLYPQKADGTYDTGVGWDGLTAVNESPSGGEITTLYANDNEYLQLLSKETYSCTIEAYTCPDEFKECDGSKKVDGIYLGQQNRKPFGFAFRTAIGNDTEGTDHGYEITLVYGCRAQPSSRNHSTINESPEAATLSWEAKATPVELPSGVYGTGLNRSATIKVRSTDFQESLTTQGYLKAFEDFLYGTDSSTEGGATVPGTDPQFPTPKQVHDLLTTGTTTNG